MSKSDRFEGKVNGLIDKGCTMEGKLAFDGIVQINGSFQGEIISDGTLVVGPDACVRGTLQVSTVIVEGNVEGYVDAKERIDLKNGSKLIADIHTTKISVEEGAMFHGQCRMLNEAVNRTNDYAYTNAEPEPEDTADSLMM
jgi:cytoskeletal protein CcmA (bactofilin family)